MPGVTTNSQSLNHQGGKQYGQLKQKQADALDAINQQFLMAATHDTTLTALEEFKRKFMLYDVDNSGGIDLMELKMMLEKLGVPKTHLQVQQMLHEVDLDGDGIIGYVEFLHMMLGKKSSVLQEILMYEAMGKEPSRPQGAPPKVTIADLLQRDSKYA